MSYDEFPEEYEVVEEEILAGKMDDILRKNRKVIARHQAVLQRKNIELRFLADCGHLIHSIEEVGGRCQHKNCNALVCRDCFRACERCMKLLCPKHQKLHKGMVLCPTCKIIALLFGLSPSNTNQQNGSQRNPISGLLFSYPVYQKWNSALYDVVYVTPDGRATHDNRERRRR